MKMCMLFLKHKKISWVASCLLMMCLGFLHAKLRAQVIVGPPPPPDCEICSCIETDMWQPLTGLPLFLQDSDGVRIQQSLFNANSSGNCAKNIQNVGIQMDLCSAQFIGLDCPLSPIAVTTGTFPTPGPGKITVLRKTSLFMCVP